MNLSNYNKEKKMTEHLRTNGYIVTIEAYGLASFTETFQIPDAIKNFSNKEYIKMIKENFKQYMRNRNINLVGKKEAYQAINPNQVEFCFKPTISRQWLYRELQERGSIELPHDITLFDAFATKGDKFNLKEIEVFVELKCTTMSQGYVWAEVYYVCNPLAPVLIVNQNVQVAYIQDIPENDNKIV